MKSFSQSNDVMHHRNLAFISSICFSEGNLFISLCPDDLSTGPLVTRLRKVFIGVLPWDSMGIC